MKGITLLSVLLSKVNAMVRDFVSIQANKMIDASYRGFLHSELAETCS